MVKLKVVSKSLTRNDRQDEVMAIVCVGVECDGLGSKLESNPAPNAHLQMVITLEEAQKYDIGDIFTLRES